MSKLSTLVGWLLLTAATVLRAGEGGSNEAVLFDFEKGGRNRFENADKLEYVPEHATQGQTSGKAVLKSGDKPFSITFGFNNGTNLQGRWGEFNQFIIDVFVEGGPVKVGNYIKDSESKSWETRYNNEFLLQPGKRKLVWPLAGLVRQQGGKPLDLARLQFFSLWFSSEDKEQAAAIYLDNARLVKGTGSFETKVLYSFEGQDAGKFVLEDWPDEFKGKSSMTVGDEHASDGGKALRLDSRAPAGNVQFSEFPPDWSRYDSLLIDIFNPADKPAWVGGWIRGDDPKSDYYHRCNYDRMLKPGFNTLRFSLGGLRTQVGGSINPSKVVSFNIAVNRQTVFIDNIRLVAGTEEVPVPGMKRFDFGPPVSALMPGFTAVSGQDRYDKARGFGWLPGADIGRDFDISEILNRHRPPDDLCRDGCMPTRAAFAVDLPNGEYRGWLMMSPPKFGWGSHFKHRTVKANGKVILDQEFTAETFKAWEFAFQDTEDLPGDDLWDKYINVLFQPTLFEFSVTDGQLKLEFDAHGQYHRVAVHGLVLWPKDQEAAAAQWLANLDGQRKEQYQALHVEKLPDAPPPCAASVADKARGYVRFIYSPDREINLNSVPAPEEAAKNGLELCAAPGETVDACFGVYPLQDCGKLKLSLTELTGPGGAVISAKNLQLQVCRYKALNKSAVYTPLPRYLDIVPADGIEIKGGITRSFWLIARVPEGAPAGAYTGEVKLDWSNVAQASRLHVNLTVWPIKLVEPDFPMGIFMMGPLGGWLDLDPTGESRWQAWKEVLQDARAHGLTSVDPLIGIPLLKYQNGKAEVDFAAGDQFMELAKAAGFKQEICGYGINTGFRMKISPEFDPGAEATKFGAPDYGQLAKAYFDAVREHAKEHNWLPICFSTDDEFLIHPGGSPEKLAALHRTLQQSAPGFHFGTYDSAVFGKSPEQDAALEKMLADIDTWGCNYHSPRQAELARKYGRRLWLYNIGMNRFTFGAYMFFARRKYDVSGFIQWVYPSSGSYGLFYLASFIEAQYGVVYPSTRGLRTTPVWERIRAGCNDHRYLETAWLLIAKAKAAGKANAASELQGLLDTLLNQLKFGNYGANYVEAEGNLDKVLPSAGLDDLRRKLAEGIVKLQEVGR